MKELKKVIIAELELLHGEYMVEKAIAINDGSYYKNQDEFHQNFYGKRAEQLIAKLPKEEIIIGGMFKFDLLGDMAILPKGATKKLLKYNGKRAKLSIQLI